MSMTTPITVEKKPVQVQALQVTDIVSYNAAQEWLEENLYQPLYGNALDPKTLRYKDQVENDHTRPEKGYYIDPATGSLVIRTLEGDMLLGLGSWLMRGIAGEFYPCADDIFQKTYTVQVTSKKEESE